jgi:hypothetical protein
VCRETNVDYSLFPNHLEQVNSFHGAKSADEMKGPTQLCLAGLEVVTG